jgi:APA family basic amino acid/polyamine antiporter
LRRALGLWSAVSIVVGTVIGGGIFLVPVSMIRHVGSVPVLFAVWIVGGLLSLFGALSYAELAAAMPEAGGEYVFLSAAYGPFWGFLYGWTQFWVAKSGSIATIGAEFYIYLAVFFPMLNQRLFSLPWHIGPGGALFEVHYGQIVAIAVIVLLATINYIGVRAGGTVQVLVTGAKVAAIAAIVLFGLFSGQGDLAHLHTSIPAAGGIAGFFAALVSALWAYDGWNNVSMVSSEIVSPQRNLPRALILGTVVCIAAYMLINTAYFYVMSPAEVAGAHRLAAEMMTRLHGVWAGKMVTAAVLISVFAALNGSILTGARIPYAMARDGLFLHSAARVHPRFQTPGAATILLCAWSCLVILSGWFDDLYNFVIFGSWILYAMTAASVIVLRWKQPGLFRPYRTIAYPFVPVLFVFVALLLLVSTLQTRPRESLMGLGLMALGIPFYFYWRAKKARSAHP